MSSFATDSLFIAALSSDSALMAEIGRRLYSTAIPLPDEDADNVPTPYIIVTFDGLTNSGTTKDDVFDGDGDEVQIGIEVAANSREQLAGLTARVRETVYRYFTEEAEDGREQVEDWTFSAEKVEYDPLKPCYWHTLHYQCDVKKRFIR